jgi:hypothetical protein
MPEVIESPEQFMKTNATPRIVRRLTRQAKREEKARDRRNAAERRSRDERRAILDVREEMIELWRRDVKEVLDANPDIPYTASVLMDMVAKHVGADYDDGRFWSHNTNPFTFIPKLIRYKLLFRKVRKAKGL